ncbi:MAG: hypothetical protein IT546_13605 [Caulobacteraceae bacterium]|nr:hypothetical protein [Caulobacteraceae bacterium]
MSAATCALLVQLAVWPLHDGRNLSQAWFNGQVDSHGIGPLEAEIGERIAELAPEARALIAAPNGPAVDCGPAFRAAGFKRAPWPRPREGFYGSPDRQPAVTFDVVRFSPSGRHALVAWGYYYAPRSAGFRYAFFERMGPRWTLRLDGRYGPIA